MTARNFTTTEIHYIEKHCQTAFIAFLHDHVSEACLIRSKSIKNTSRYLRTQVIDQSWRVITGPTCIVKISRLKSVLPSGNHLIDMRFACFGHQKKTTMNKFH